MAVPGGGALRLNADKARHVFEALIARPLGLSLAMRPMDDQIAASNMMRSSRRLHGAWPRPARLRAVCVWWQWATVCGWPGRGVVHAAHYCPPAPACFRPLASCTPCGAPLFTAGPPPFAAPARSAGSLNAAWDRLVADAVAQLTADGFTPGQMCIRRAANLHYQGQTFELSVPVPTDALDAPDSGRARRGIWPGARTDLMGIRAGPDEPVEMVTMQVIGQGLPDRPRVPAKLLPPEASTVSRLAARQAYFGPQLAGLPHQCCTGQISPRPTRGHASLRSTTRPCGTAPRQGGVGFRREEVIDLLYGTIQSKWYSRATLSPTILRFSSSGTSWRIRSRISRDLGKVDSAWG